MDDQREIMENKKQFPPTTIPTIISIAMLLAGMPDFFPYGFYTLLRLVVCGTSGYIAFFAFEEEKTVIAFISGFIALLFNPLIPVHLNKELWVIIDFIVATYLFLTIFILRTINTKRR